MFATLHRFVPFLNRGRRVSRSNVQNQEAALTQDETEASSSWLTLSQTDCPSNRKQSNQIESQSANKLFSSRSQRIINGAIAQFRSRREEFIIEDDISNGREKFKIPAISYKRNDRAPCDYHYVTEHIQYEPAPVDVSLVKISCCDCINGCSDGRCFCSSNHKSGKCYDSKGRLSSEYSIDAPEIIYECNAACSCNRKECKNMTIQGGCKQRLVLFRTKGRGWGVRTLETLKRGTFIGVYSGELISANDSYQRQDDTYLFNLASSRVYTQSQPSADEAVEDKAEIDPVESTEQEQKEPESEIVESGEKQEQVETVRASDQFVCDAKFYGNFTRFINHSCKPNVIGIRSYTSHQDHRFPYIAFFTNSEVPADTELTLHYGDNYWLVKCKRDNIYCLCRESKCRFTKKTFPRTLKVYQRQKNRH